MSDEVHFLGAVGGPEVDGEDVVRGVNLAACAALHVSGYRACGSITTRSLSSDAARRDPGARQRERGSEGERETDGPKRTHILDINLLVGGGVLHDEPHAGRWRDGSSILPDAAPHVKPSAPRAAPAGAGARSPCPRSRTSVRAPAAARHRGYRRNPISGAALFPAKTIHAWAVHVPVDSTALDGRGGRGRLRQGGQQIPRRGRRGRGRWIHVARGGGRLPSIRRQRGLGRRS